ncbi:hypothetical protein Lalb_Chr12g0205721 [Lupinus albus]|uniref:Beta-1,3-N-acetylglucosaminyltransferase family protein n=1 Tax=Lupinus albus TaxID=3870 RepID=A0A6A4PN33_LUPAL|nr:hypothetical protein Lalb_Chr12g0205721 [Lupinus albus]
MAATNKIFSILLFLGLIFQGYGQSCSLNDLSVSVAKAGSFIQGKPEWEVTIANNCVCKQQNVKLNCTGFQTLELIDPSVLSVSGNVCLVNAGKPIISNDPFTFKYAWDYLFQLTPINSTIACS